MPSQLAPPNACPSMPCRKEERALIHVTGEAAVADMWKLPIGTDITPFREETEGAKHALGQTPHPVKRRQEEVKNPSSQASSPRSANLSITSSVRQANPRQAESAQRVLTACCATSAIQYGETAGVQHD